MQGSPSATNVGYGSSATLTAPPDCLLTRSVFPPQTLLVGVAVGTGLMQIGMETCMVCCPPPPHSLSISVLSSLTFHVFSTRLAYPILSVLLRCK